MSSAGCGSSGAASVHLALITLGGVLATNLLIGERLAVALSMLDLLARLKRPHDAVLGLVIYRNDTPLCFAKAENVRRRVLAAIAGEEIPVEWFVLNAEAIAEVDITAADALHNFAEELQHQTAAQRWPTEAKREGAQPSP